MAKEKKGENIFGFWKKEWEDGSVSYSCEVKEEQVETLSKLFDAAQQARERLYIQVSKNRFKEEGDNKPDLQAYVKYPKGYGQSQGSSQNQQSYDDIEF